MKTETRDLEVFITKDANFPVVEVARMLPPFPKDHKI